MKKTKKKCFALLARLAFTIVFIIVFVGAAQYYLKDHYLKDYPFMREFTPSRSNMASTPKSAEAPWNYNFCFTYNPVVGKKNDVNRRKSSLRDEDSSSNSIPIVLDKEVPGHIFIAVRSVDGLNYFFHGLSYLVIIGDEGVDSKTLRHKVSSNWKQIWTEDGLPKDFSLPRNFSARSIDGTEEFVLKEQESPEECLKFVICDLPPSDPTSETATPELPFDWHGKRGLLIYSLGKKGEAETLEVFRGFFPTANGSIPEQTTTP
ncbi:MAG: hypothetical protein ACOX2O_10250 [Bdellovibrionota bacterium]|jgi:hypothetical protein